MKLTEEEILHNWNELHRLVNATYSGKRKAGILSLLTHFEERLALAPASAKDFYHNAFPGGLVAHTLNVIKCSKELKDVWERMGCDINFTDEELVTSALFHDLGKVGDLDNDYYIPQSDEWRRNKLRELYTFNKDIDYMSVTDRTFFLLAHFEIELTTKEYIAIRLADGLYAEANKSYLVAFNESGVIRSNLPFIIHAADFMAMKSEYDKWRLSDKEEEGVPEKSTQKYQRKKTVSEVAQEVGSKSLKDGDTLFKALFEEAASKSEKKS